MTRIFIEDVVDIIDWSKAESFLNMESGAILIFNYEYERAWQECQELVSDISDEQICDILGYDDPEFVSFIKQDELFRRLPDGFYIHGYRIMEDFIANIDDEGKREALQETIRGEDAFHRLESAASRLDLLSAWFNYKEQRLLEIARAWCAENGIAYTYRNPEKAVQHRVLEQQA